MKKLTPNIQEVIERYQDRYRSFQPKNEETIHVEKDNGSVSFYEKIKNFITPQQKHSLRRYITNLLQQKLIINEENEIAESLIKELIKNNYLPNDEIPEAKIEEVQAVINKMVFILGHASEDNTEKSKEELQKWLLKITACEIKEILTPHRKREFIEYMSKMMRKRMNTNPQQIDEEQEEIQSLIAAQKALFDSDKPLLSYYILLKKLPYWQDPDQEQLTNITADIYDIWGDIRNDLTRPLQEKFHETYEKYAPAFMVSKNIITEIDSIESLKKPEQLEKKIKEVYQEKVKKLKNKIFKLVISSALLITLIRIIIFLFVELPLTEFPFTWPAIITTTLMPAILLLLSLLIITPPDKRDLNLIILETMKLFYGKEEVNYNVTEDNDLRKKTLIRFYHLFGFLLFSGIIITGLYQLSLPLLSFVISLTTIYLVSFIIFKLQQRVEQIKLQTLNGNLFQEIINSLAYPIIKFNELIKN